MHLKEYFEKHKGVGILGTSDKTGRVDMAIYARPYVIDEDTVAFSMLERLSYSNISENPKAAYIFIEKSEGYEGVRLYLTRIRQEDEPERIRELKEKHGRVFKEDQKNRHIVYFRVDNKWPLVGNKGEPEASKRFQD